MCLAEGHRVAVPDGRAVDQDILPGASVKPILSESAYEQVAAAEAEQEVGAGTTRQDVVPVVADKEVVALTADEVFEVADLAADVAGQAGKKVGIHAGR